MLAKTFSVRAEVRLCVAAPSVTCSHLVRPILRRSTPALASSYSPRSRTFLRTRQVCSARTFLTYATATQELEPHLQKIKEQGFQLKEFDPDEVKQAVVQLEAAMGEGCKATEMELKLFARDRSLDIASAKEKLNQYLDWRAEGFSGLTAEDPAVASEIALGKAYLLATPDVLGRPVVVVKAPLQITATRDLEATKKLCVWLMDSALEQLESTSHESILCIFDLRGFGTKNADIAFLKFFIDVMFKYYPKRIANVLLVEPPFVFKPVWVVIKPLLGRYSSLVRFSKTQELKEYIGQENL